MFSSSVDGCHRHPPSFPATLQGNRHQPRQFFAFDSTFNPILAARRPFFRVPAPPPATAASSCACRDQATFRPFSKVSQFCHFHFAKRARRARHPVSQSVSQSVRQSVLSESVDRHSAEPSWHARRRTFHSSPNCKFALRGQPSRASFHSHRSRSVNVALRSEGFASNDKCKSAIRNASRQILHIS